MTERTLIISYALREAQLQRLEASLASKAAAQASGHNKASQGRGRKGKRLITTVPTHSLINSAH